MQLFLILISIIGFSVFLIKPEKEKAITPIITSVTPTSTTKKQTINQSTPTPITLQKLTVLPLKCIGCGKCAKIDSSHFEMNYSTDKAIVISSTNLNSSVLTQAINNCPTRAITLK